MIVNCMRHSHRPLDQRPADCELCKADIENWRAQQQDEQAERTRRLLKAGHEMRLAD